MLFQPPSPQSPLQNFYDQYMLHLQGGQQGQDPNAPQGTMQPLQVQKQTQSNGGPLTNFLNSLMTNAGNNSVMQNMGGFNNPGAQVGLNNINWE